ncbi:MAG: NUDIX hydrolase [Phycisphaerales bacterium]|nr:NUDIX hydrolase [Phycisphaerales bacterium]
MPSMDPISPPHIVHAGPVFRVERLEFALPERPGGPPVVRHVVRHPGAVAVVAVLPDGRLVFVRNHRVAVNEWLLELCAGKLEPGEDPAHAAARELEEETGHAADRMVPLGTFFTSPGFADELMHVFEATGLRPVPQRLEPGEQIEVAVLEVSEVLDMIGDGRIRDGKTIAGIMLWLRRGEAGAGE